MILWTRFCRIVSNQRRCPNESKIYQRVQGSNCSIAWSRTACFRSSQRVRSCQPNYILMGHLYGKSEKSIKRPIDTWLLLSPCLRRWRYAPLTVAKNLHSRPVDYPFLCIPFIHSSCLSYKLNNFYIFYTI